MKKWYVGLGLSTVFFNPLSTHHFLFNTEAQVISCIVSEYSSWQKGKVNWGLYHLNQQLTFRMILTKLVVTCLQHNTQAVAATNSST